MGLKLPVTRLFSNSLFRLTTLLKLQITGLLWSIPPLTDRIASNADNVSKSSYILHAITRVRMVTQISRFMGPTWGPPGSCRPQMGPMVAPWTLISGQTSRTISYEYTTLLVPFRCHRLTEKGLVLDTWLCLWLHLRWDVTSHPCLTLTAV